MMSDRIVFEKNGKTITAEHSGLLRCEDQRFKNSEDGGRKYEGTGRKSQPSVRLYTMMMW